jgi:putative MATE family efflux protein
MPQTVKTPINSLESESISSLLLKYSLPAIVGTTASSLYNIIDRIFIGQGVGHLAISGLAVTFPLMLLALAFGTLVGAGASATISIRLGEKNYEEAFKVLGNALFLNLTIGITYTLTMFYFLDEVLLAFGASENTLPFAKEFMRIILCGSVVTHIFFGLNAVMRATGYPRKAMMNLLTTVGLNLLLAPLFIFGFGWGIKGAAVATVISQFVGMLLVLHHFSQKSNVVYFVKGCLKPNKNIILNILSIGLSPFLLHLCASAVSIIMNVSLNKYGGDLAVGAYGIINSVVGMFTMIVVGMNQGMQPIVGYNYGAGKYERVIKTYKYTVLSATCVTTIGFLLAMFIPRQIASAFTVDEGLIELTITGMRTTFIAFLVVGFQMVSSNFFQAIGKPKISIFLSLSRQVVFLIPALIIVPLFLDLRGVWFATPVADIVASLITLMVVKYQLGKIIKKGNKII